jgi:streptogrisin C
MLRSRKTVATVVGLAAAALAAAAGPASAADDARGKQLEAGIEAYQHAFPKITPEAAELAAKQQDDRKELYLYLTKGGDRSFGGASFDPVSGILKVFATDKEIAAQAAQTGDELGLKVQTQIVERSFSDLEREAAAVRARKDTLGSVARGTSGIQVENNRFVVSVTPAQRALVQEAADAAGVTLVDTPRRERTQYDSGCTSRSACDWTIRAGAMIWTPSAGNNDCSVGFTARNAANQRFTYTAGHCSSGAGINWGTGGQPIGALSSARNSGPVDASIIPVTNPWFVADHGGEIYNEFFPGRSVAVNSVAPTLSYIWTGDLVCLAANFTSANGPNFCGVVGTNSDSSERGMVRVDGLDACPGDSGGGWYWLTSTGRRIAYGIHSRSNPGCHGDAGGSHSWFSALPTVKSTYTPTLTVETR